MVFAFPEAVASTTSENFFNDPLERYLTQDAGFGEREHHVDLHPSLDQPELPRQSINEFVIETRIM